MTLQEQLKELFVLDSHLRGLRRRLDAGLGRRQAQERKLAQLQQQQAELNEQMRREQVAATTLEHQTQDIDNRINKLREQMNSATSNKQYQAMLVEINTLKLDKSKIEDQALEKLNQVEQLKTALAELAEQALQQQKLVDLAIREVAAAREEVGEQVDDVTSKRDQALQAIPPDARDVFDRLTDAHDGEFLAGVEEADRRRREYNCAGCYMQLPINIVSTLISRPDELVCCPNCQRILYVENNLREALAPAKQQA